MHNFVIDKVSPIFKAKRWQLFMDWHIPQHGESILDLGGGDGSLLAELYPYPENIILADIDGDVINAGVNKYGLNNSLLLDECGDIPLDSKSIDIVFCNSVIEHATIDKKCIWELKDGRKFKELAFIRQAKMAREIMRVGKKYWVQTPYRHFLFETHTWLPAAQYLPRILLVETIKFFNRFWIKKTSPDFFLLSITEARALFPNAEIIFEKVCGVPKSLIVRSPIQTKNDVKSLL